MQHKVMRRSLRLFFPSAEGQEHPPLLSVCYLSHRCSGN
uniref:Uncharacterized protein n=1 Tax=Arundo donax TaxID=35708 RepID=A0A0A9ANB0_ARUDO